MLLAVEKIDEKFIKNIKLFYDNETKKSYLFSYQKNRLTVFEYDIDSGQLKLNNYIDSLNIKNYFISKLFNNNTYLIYCSNFDNILSFVKLNEIP
jgi:hypothetical protein